MGSNLRWTLNHFLTWRTKYILYKHTEIEGFGISLSSTTKQPLKVKIPVYSSSFLIYKFMPEILNQIFPSNGSSFNNKMKKRNMDICRIIFNLWINGHFCNSIPSVSDIN